jgi:hypothetical protein
LAIFLSVTNRAHPLYPGMTKLLYVVPLVLAGCAVDDSGDDPSISETEQAVSGTILSTHSCSTYPRCDFDLGSKTNTTCVIAGLQGQWGRGGFAAIGPGVNNNENWLTIMGVDGYTVTISTLCVTPAQHVTTAKYSPNFSTGPVKIPNTTASSRCFLTQFDFDAGAMNSYWDSIQTWKDRSGSWWVYASAASGFIDASATCFDATDDGAWAWGQTGGTTTGNLASNLGGGVACGLTEVGGVYNAETPDGVSIDYLPREWQWTWTFRGAHHAYSNCIK